MSQQVKARERVPTGRRGRPSKSMIAAALERPFCAYLHKICLNNRLEGHRYCIDHIMNDKTAPYRVCTYVHSVTGRRCSRAAHKVDRRASPLCHYHKSLKLNAPPAPTVPIDDDSSDPKTLIRDLAHHSDPSTAITFPHSEMPRPTENPYWVSKPDGSAIPSDKLTRILARYNARRQEEHKKPIELPTIEEIAARHNNADSDTESVDNQDLFKHTSVFTEEELTRTLRDKMIKLRRLYIEQYGHIQYILKEKRLKYIQAQRIEDDMFGELYSFRNNRDSPDYTRLRAMLRYHKTFGPESLLQDQAKRKRMSRPPTIGPHPHPNAPSPHIKPNSNDVHCNKAIHHSNSTNAVNNVGATDTPNNSTSNNSTTPADSTATATTTATPTPTPTSTTTATTTPTPAATTETISTNAAPTNNTTQVTNVNNINQKTNVCIFSKTPQGCDKPTVPLSPYCRQHILYDTKQVLFRPCAGGAPPCLTPVVSYVRKNKCWLHTAIN